LPRLSAHRCYVVMCALQSSRKQALSWTVSDGEDLPVALKRDDPLTCGSLGVMPHFLRESDEGVAVGETPMFSAIQKGTQSTTV